jgi:hypothetical protein
MGHYALDSIPLCVLLSQNEAETIEEVNALNATAQTK